MRRPLFTIPVLLLCAWLLPSAHAQEVADPASAATRLAHATPEPVATPQRQVATSAPRTADRAVDRLQLDATSITGNRELPKVMSIVPWKAAEPPAGPDRPMGSLIEELLTPLDRDEFRREITYYRDLTSQSATPTTVAAPGAK
jgi:hypothetical protein